MTGTFVRVSSPKHGDVHWRFLPRHLTVPVRRVASTGVARDSAGDVGTVGHEHVWFDEGSSPGNRPHLRLLPPCSRYCRTALISDVASGQG
jgi:hypothetical protein